jgi:hypothetical protein
MAYAITGMILNTLKALNILYIQRLVDVALKIYDAVHISFSRLKPNQLSMSFSEGRLIMARNDQEETYRVYKLEELEW